jgi:predicted RNA-binding protein with PUA-like domain
MTMQYWLVKQEPEAYSWETFLKDKKTSWDGVRNFQARNNLRAMKVGDPVLFYASVTTKAVQGLAEVARSAYPDPTADEGDWSSVELRAKQTLPRAVTLDQIKADPALANMALLKQSRLSVTPLTKTEYQRLLKLGGL